MRTTIPVTILSGSLGAGKTTLVNHLLSTADDNIAVLVNDMGEVNVDAALVAEGSELDIDDGVTELSNGCICCELQDDLESAVVKLARERSFDYLVVESSGISEPAPVARLFTTESRVAALYGVDALVTVLDTRRFLDCFSGESVPERCGSEGDRPLSDLLVDQVEVSNIVLLNKIDQCTDAEVTEAETLVRALQPAAETVRTEFSVIDPRRLLGLNCFEKQTIADLPGWKRALEDRADHEHEDQAHEHDELNEQSHEHDANSHKHDEHHDHYHPDEVYGISSFTYRRRQPFHPVRFAEFLQSLPPTIVRAKGTAWIAGTEIRVSVSQAGQSVRATGQGPWIASLVDVDREMYRSNRPNLEWHEEHGDRLSELVFIGTAYDEGELRAGLSNALLTDQEQANSDHNNSAERRFPTETGTEVVVRAP